MAADELFVDVPKSVITSRGECRKWRMSEKHAKLLRATYINVRKGIEYPVTKDRYYYFGPITTYSECGPGGEQPATAAVMNARLKKGWSKGEKGEGGQPTKEPIGVKLQSRVGGAIVTRTFKELESFVKSGGKTIPTTPRPRKTVKVTKLPKPIKKKVIKPKVKKVTPKKKVKIGVRQRGRISLKRRAKNIQR